METSQYAAPARAKDLTGLPPAHVTVFEFDPLRYENLTYASRLVQSGVHAEMHLYPGAFHGCTNLSGLRFTERIIDALSRALDPSRTALLPIGEN